MHSVARSVCSRDPIHLFLQFSNLSPLAIIAVIVLVRVAVPYPAALWAQQWDALPGHPSSPAMLRSPPIKTPHGRFDLALLQV